MAAQQTEAADSIVPAAAKNGKPHEKIAEFGRQMKEAPLDSGPQRAVAFLRVALPADQEIEAAGKLTDHLSGAEGPRSCGGEFEGQRNAFEPTAQRGNRFGIARRDLKVGRNRLRPVHEKPDARNVQQGFGRSGQVIGDGQRRQREFAFAA